MILHDYMPIPTFVKHSPATEKPIDHSCQLMYNAQVCDEAGGVEAKH